MATLTISAAARLCHCDRRTLQRAIHAGRLHLDAHHSLSREELLATGYLISDTPQETPQTTPQGTPQETPQLAALRPLLQRLTLAIEALCIEIQRLRETPPAAPQETPQAVPQRTPRATPRAAPQPRTYDPRKFVLGKLCPGRHAYGNTGQSLLRLPSRNCPVCTNAGKRKKRAARRSRKRKEGAGRTSP